MKTWLLLLIVSAATAAEGVRDQARTEEQLRSVPFFAFGAIGFAGLPAPGEVALRELLTHDDATMRLETLLESGSAEAKCYALVGLRALDPAKFEQYAARFRASPPARVLTMSACFVATKSGLAILADIEAGRHAVWSPPKKPNKAPEPTPGTVTPRASSGNSK